MQFTPLLIAAIFVAPPIPREPDPEPGIQQDAVGDPLPAGAVARYGTLRYRAGFAGVVAFTRDGKAVMSGGTDNCLHFWETDTGKLLRRFKAFSGYNHSFARSPDGKQIITGDFGDYDVILRELATGKVIRRYPGLKNYPGTLAFSPDGKLIAAAESHTGIAVVWDKETGKEIARVKMDRFGRPWQQPVVSLAFSPNGKYMAIADRELMIFEVKTWKHMGNIVGHSDHIYNIAFTPDSSKVITGSWDRTLRVWNFASKKETRRVSDELHASFVLTPDGKLAIGNDTQGRLCAWNIETGNRLYRSDTKILANRFALSEDGSRVVATTFSAVLVYDAKTGKCLTPLPVPEYAPRMVAFSPNGKYLALAYGPDDVRLWRFQAGSIRRLPRVKEFPLLFGMQVNQKNEVVLFGSGPTSGIEVWNLTHKKCIGRLPGAGYCTSVAFTKDETSVFAAGRELLEWSPALNQIEWVSKLTSAHPVVLLSGDERILLSLRDGDATTWSAVSGKSLSNFTIFRRALALAISPDGTQFVIGGEQTAELRATLNGTVLQDLGRKQVVSAAFSPDGRLLAVADGPGAVQIWDTKTRKRLRRIKGHRESVTKLLFSPDGKWLASVSLDTTIHVWDMRKVAPGRK